MKHHVQRQGDELYCPRCGRRWGIDDDAPPCEDQTLPKVVSVSDKDPPIVRPARHLRTQNVGTPMFRRKTP